MEIYSILLTLHIISGFTALIIGLVPMIGQKGSTRHIVSGKIYFWASFGVFLTSSSMFFFKPDELLFLLLVGIFSFYQTFSGARIVRYKNPQKRIAPLDWSVGGLVLIAGLSMIFLGGRSLYTGIVGLGILYLVFGTLCTGLALMDLKDFYQRHIGDWPEKRHWLFRHVSRMGGSYIATFTAFCVVNVDFLPNLVVWLSPGVIGGILIARTIRGLKGKATKPLRT